MPNVAQNIIEGLKKQYMSEVEAMKAIQAGASDGSRVRMLFRLCARLTRCLQTFTRLQSDGRPTNPCIAEIAQNRSNQEQLMSQASENEMVLDVSASRPP